MEPFTSVQSYDVLADALSKFQASPEWIKALWLMGPLLTILGVTWLVTQAAREIAGAVLARREGAPQRGWILQRQPIFAIYRDAHGRSMLYAKGIVQELGAESPAEDMRLPAPRWRH